MADPISLRSYARQRRVSAKSVVLAIRSGRLSASVVHTAEGPKIADTELADREWAANTDHTRAPTYVKAREAARDGPRDVESQAESAAAASRPPAQSAPTMSLGDASALAMEWRAKRAELEDLERSARLVDAAAVESKWVESITRCRTKLLGVPSKLKAARPNMSRDDLVHVDRIIREALEDLADDPQGVDKRKSIDLR